MTPRGILPVMIRPAPIGLALALALALGACSSKKESPAAGTPGAATTTAGAARPSAAPVPDVAVVPTWEVVKLDHGSFKRPSGGDWTYAAPAARSDKADLTVTFQKLGDGDFLAELDQLQGALDQANSRDAPKWVQGEKARTQIAGEVALRSDGAFDNGTAYVTRDYIIVTKAGAVAVMTRGPAPAKTTVQQLADYVASTFTR